MNVGVQWLPQTAFLFMVIFARVGTILMLMPALGESSIPARMRLTFALAFSFVLFPLLSATLPTLPNDLISIGVLLGHEIAIGLILGGIVRMIVVATQVAGATIAFQSGLSIAQAADPSQTGVQGVIIGNFMSMLGVTLIFATNLHHMALAAIYDSYRMFPPAEPLMLGDAAHMAVNALSNGFVVGVQMAAPFIVFGLVFNVGIGILARLMPQLQVYFLMMPANIGIGLILLAVLLTSMMGWYLTHFQAQLTLLTG